MVEGGGNSGGEKGEVVRREWGEGESNQRESREVQVNNVGMEM